MTTTNTIPPGAATLGVLRKATIPALARAIMSAGVAADVLPHLTRLCELAGYDDIGVAGRQEAASEDAVRLEGASLTEAVEALQQILDRLKSIGPGEVCGGGDVLRAVQELHRATNYPIEFVARGGSQRELERQFAVQLLRTALRIYRQHRNPIEGIAEWKAERIRLDINGDAVGAEAPGAVESLVWSLASRRHPERLLGIACARAGMEDRPAVAPDVAPQQRKPGFWVVAGRPGVWVAVTYDAQGVDYGGAGPNEAMARSAALDAAAANAFECGILDPRAVDLESVAAKLQVPLEAVREAFQEAGGS